MKAIEILEKAKSEGKPVRIVLDDGIVLDGVMVVDCSSYDDIELDVPQELIDECRSKGRGRVCIIDWDEIESVEIIDG